MSTVAQIKDAIASLSLEEMNEVSAWLHPKASLPGPRLVKLVGEAGSGKSAVPEAVALISDEPLSKRAVDRSHELIREHGWNV